MGSPCIISYNFSSYNYFRIKKIKNMTEKISESLEYLYMFINWNALNIYFLTISVSVKPTWSFSFISS